MSKVSKSPSVKSGFISFIEGFTFVHTLAKLILDVQPAQTFPYAGQLP